VCVDANFWATVERVVRTIEAQSSNAVSKMALNFGLWDIAVSDDGTIDCHAHMHIVLDRAATVALAEKWLVLAHRTRAPTENYAEQNVNELVGQRLAAVETVALHSRLDKHQSSLDLLQSTLAEMRSTLAQQQSMLVQMLDDIKGMVTRLDQIPVRGQLINDGNAQARLDP